MRKNLIFAVLFSVPAALAASGLESDRTQQLPTVDAGSLLNQINSQNDNFINPMPQAIISQEMQFALEAASELRKDLKNYGIKAKVGLVNEPVGGYGLWVEFRNWSDYEKIKDLFYQDPGNNPSYMDLKVYPRVPKKSIDYRPEEVTVHFFDEWGAGEKQIPAALKKHGIEVVSVENEGNVTTIIYKSANWMIKTSDTKGEYGPSDNKEIDAEIRQITRNLQKEGKTVVWSGRWDDMVNGGTVYYLEPKMHIMVSKSAQEADKKIKACWLKNYEKNLCNYKCGDGSLYSQPVQIPLPWDNTPVIPCPQLVFPF